MAEVLWSEPTRLVSGDTWEWNRALTDYPASAGWVLTYAFRSASAYFNVTASADGDNHAVSVATTTTDDIAKGRYYWQSYATKGSERYTVGSGVLEVAANFAGTAAASDQRTHARKMLEAIEAVLEDRASNDVMEYSIGGRSLKRIPRAELMRLHAYYRNQVAVEEGTGGNGRSLGVTFA